MLEGCHGGMVGTKSLGEENGPRLLYGYDYGFVFGFLCLLCKQVDVVEGISLKVCCSDGGVSNVRCRSRWWLTFEQGRQHVHYRSDNTNLGLYFEEVDERW